MSKAKVYTIKSLANELNLTEGYVRRAIHKGELETTLANVGDTNVQRHEVTQAQVDAWREKASSRSRREDGRNKYVIYMNDEEFEAMKSGVVSEEVVATCERAYQKKEEEVVEA